MIHVHQPAGTKLCGQACVAMVAGVSLAQAVEAVGKWHATSSRDLIRGLKRLGVDVDLHYTKNKTPALIPAPYAIIRLTCPGNRLPDGKHWGGHWVVSWSGEMYDPSPGMLPGRCSMAWAPGLRASSWIGFRPVTFLASRTSKGQEKP